VANHGCEGPEVTTLQEDLQSWAHHRQRAERRVAWSTPDATRRVRGPRVDLQRAVSSSRCAAAAYLPLGSMRASETPGTTNSLPYSARQGDQLGRQLLTVWGLFEKGTLSLGASQCWLCQ